MTAASTPGARAEWHASRAENLCTRGARYVTGSDIVRVSRALALEPWHVTQTAPAAADDPTGIVTDGGRRRVNLRLANGPHGCVFLLRTSGGLGHCGIGELAPVSCRVFPAHLGESAPAAPGKPTDGVRESTEKDLDQETQETQETLAEAKRGWAADRDDWFDVVKRWNALPDESGSDDEPDIRVFQRYLLEAYASSEAERAKSAEAAS